MPSLVCPETSRSLNQNLQGSKNGGTCDLRGSENGRTYDFRGSEKGKNALFPGPGEECVPGLDGSENRRGLKLGASTQETRSNEEQEEEDEEIKEFVVIGNGPSGISLSLLLDGHWPYYAGESEDDLLHARLMAEPHLSLVEQDLEFLSDGLEGRSTNPVALLLDSLQRPQADLGLDLPSLLDWRRDEATRVNHVVLGRGKPGGVWQTLDGNLKTVSLGAWMQLPNLPLPEWEVHNTALVNRRTSIASVAHYYTDYVDIMGLTPNFRNHTVVTQVRQVERNSGGRVPERQGDFRDLNSAARKQCARGDLSAWSSREATTDISVSEAKVCDFSSVPTNFFTEPAEDVFSLDDELSSDCSSFTPHSFSPSRDTELRLSCEDYRSGSPYSVGLTENCDFEPSTSSYNSYRLPIPDISEICPSWDPIINPHLFSCCPLRNSVTEVGRSWNSWFSGQISNSLQCKNSPQRSLSQKSTASEKRETLFEVTGYEVKDGGEMGGREVKHFKYLANNVVLATGLDKPNRLGVEGEDLSFVIHSLRDLELTIEQGRLTSNSDPILIIGAGLSAADAIICVQGYNIPVVHVFRRPVDDPQLIFNKLPVNLYPEYHKVHRMMAEGSIESARWLRGEVLEREHPKYRAFSETGVRRITRDRRVDLLGPHTNAKIQVSCVLVLIGASPRLEFLDTETQLGRVPGAPLDKNNTIDIDVFTHQSVNVPGLFAMGPLVGDNFVRFLQGGALAIASFAHRDRVRREASKLV